MKIKKAATTYALATQGIFSMICFAVIGFVIGYAIDKTSPWPAILAVVGVLVGLFVFISNLLYLLREDEKERKKGKLEVSDDEKESI